MAEIVFKLKEKPCILDVEGVITPNAIAGKTLEEINNMVVQAGKTKKLVSELFEVNGEAGATPEETKIILEGDLSSTKRIGADMNGGEIIVNSNVGMFVGHKMSGGSIVVNGDADSYVGAEMSGGEITIKGNAGDYVGAAYKGDVLGGMTGGKIIIEGDAACEVGMYLNGGTIIVKGNVDLLCGIHMQKGLIIVEGCATARLGESAEGKGTIIVKGKLLVGAVSYLYTETVENPEIEGYGVVEGKFFKFEGDTACRGNRKTKMYLTAGCNTHLLPGNPIPASNLDAYEALHRD